MLFMKVITMNREKNFVGNAKDDKEWWMGDEKKDLAGEMG